MKISKREKHESPIEGKRFILINDACFTGCVSTASHPVPKVGDRGIIRGIGMGGMIRVDVGTSIDWWTSLSHIRIEE